MRHQHVRGRCGEPHIGAGRDVGCVEHHGVDVAQTHGHTEPAIGFWEGARAAAAFRVRVSGRFHGREDVNDAIFEFGRVLVQGCGVGKKLPRPTASRLP